ncbi:unnamed protein product [Lota lota]
MGRMKSRSRNFWKDKCQPEQLKGDEAASVTPGYTSGREHLSERWTRGESSTSYEVHLSRRVDFQDFHKVRCRCCVMPKTRELEQCPRKPTCYHS